MNPIRTLWHRLGRGVLPVAAAVAASCGGGRPAQTADPAAQRGETLRIEAPASADGSAPAIRTDTVRFGRLRSGEIAVKPIWIENGCERPIVIASYTTSCGCVSVEYEPRPIAPGDAQQIAFRFDTRGELGWQLKIIRIFFGGDCPPLRVLVDADVVSR